MASHLNTNYLRQHNKLHKITLYKRSKVLVLYISQGRIKGGGQIGLLPRGLYNKGASTKNSKKYYLRKHKYTVFV